MRIVIGGDVSNMYSPKAFAQKDTDKCFDKGVQNLFKSADEVIVNLEQAITESDHAIKKFGPNIKAPFGTGDVLKQAGVTICALSNNHIFDFGKPGVKDTLAELDRVGLKYTGYGKNKMDARKDYIIEHQGKKIAIIDVCEHEYSYALDDREGTREFDTYQTMFDIIDAKKKADYVVVIYHGGKEHCEYPSPRLMNVCRAMVMFGADVVLGQHSHCIGCYEQYEGGHILYGQGNFHFSDNLPPEAPKKTFEMWNTGLAVVLDIDDNGLKFSVLPTILETPTLRLANETEKKDILDKLEKRSSSIKDGTWYDGWLDFVKNVEWYKTAMLSGDADRIAHFLDCEAHHDVVSEIFKTWNQTNEKD